MISFTMSIDKFGRSLQSQRRSVHPYADLLKVRGLLLRKSEDGNYDFGNLRLCNVADPTLSQDASTKQYTDQSLENLKKPLLSDISDKTVKLESMLKRHVSDAIANLGEDLKKQLVDVKLEIYGHHSQAERHMKSEFEKSFNDKYSLLEDRIEKNLHQLESTLKSHLKSLKSKLKSSDEEIEKLAKKVSKLSHKEDEIESVIIPALDKRLFTAEETIGNIGAILQ